MTFCLPIILTQKLKTKSIPNPNANPVSNSSPIFLTLITCSCVTSTTNVVLRH